MKKTARYVLPMVFLMILPVIVFAGKINLPKTGQTTCYDEDGGVIDCTGTGQDGDTQAGVEWPSPRFTDNNDGTVTDNLTGLMWLKDANCFGDRTWQEALVVVTDVNTSPLTYNCSDYTANYDDWRLPNFVELESLVNAEESNYATWLNTQGFTNVQGGDYWSATARDWLTYSKGRYFWVVGMSSSGHQLDDEWRSNRCNVWPVRGGESGPAQTWQTGQTTSYADGDDGDLQRGVSWPAPRFEDNGDGTITDHLTGLIWLKKTYCFGRKTLFQALADCNNLASGSCGLSDGSVAGDWRLPNRKELFSLIDYSRSALPQGHLFDIVEGGSSCWSATTHAYYIPYQGWYLSAWVVSMSGHVALQPKSNHFDVWAVRAGQDGEFPNPVSEIIGTWSNGIRYWDVAAAQWTQMTSGTPTGDIAAGDFTGDGISDVASCWASGLWYQDGATLDWTKVSGPGAVYLTAEDVTGDGRSEIIGTWSSGIWYWDVATAEWTKMTASTPTGDIAAGDFTGDGKADVASCWTNGLWYQGGATLDWTKVSNTAPTQVTAGDVTGDGRDEIIGIWSSGIWYWDVAALNWTQMTASTPTGDIAAGDFTGDGKADVASCWSNGLWYQGGATLDWTKVSNTAPTQVTAGDLTGD